MEINQNNEIWFQIFDNKKLPPIKVVCTVLAVVALLSYHRTKMSAITRYTHNTAQPIVEHGLAQMWRRLFTRSLQPGAVLVAIFSAVRPASELSGYHGSSAAPRVQLTTFKPDTRHSMWRPGIMESIETLWMIYQRTRPVIGHGAAAGTRDKCLNCCECCLLCWSLL